MFTTHPARTTVRRIAARTSAAGTHDHDMNPRTSVRTKRMARSLTAMVVAAGSVAALAGPAQAYDNGTCNSRFGTANVDEVDTVRRDTGQVGKVDFGDGAHPFGDAPQGNAVVCWQHHGRVAVVGRLYADPSPSKGSVNASAKINYYNNGVVQASTSSAVTSTNGVVTNKKIDEATAPGYFDRVRIRLYNGTTLVHESNRYRGD